LFGLQDQHAHYCRTYRHFIALIIFRKDCSKADKKERKDELHLLRVRVRVGLSAVSVFQEALMGKTHVS
jgi:CHAD domain-containing protein